MLERVRSFCEKSESLGLNGLDFQHVRICARRAWLHRKRCNFNELSEHIKLGMVLHENLDDRRKTVDGISGIMPDQVDWTVGVVREVKRSTSHLEASILQTLFYAAFFTNATGRKFSAVVSSKDGKRKTKAELDDGHLSELERHLEHLKLLDEMRTPPEAIKVNACSGCSNAEFCWGGRP